MLLIGLLLACAMLLSTRVVKAAVPSESLLAVTMAGVACVALFELGRLG